MDHDREGRKKVRRKYSLPEAKLKLERQIGILRALVHFSDKGKNPISYKEIKGVGSKSSVSSELAFFADAGLATKGKNSKYLPTQDVIEFVNDLERGKDVDAKSKLRDILLRSWFGEFTRKILTISKRSKEELIKELGGEAEADPKKDLKAIEKLVEWMEYAELIEIDENNNVYIKYQEKEAPSQTAVTESGNEALEKYEQEENNGIEKGPTLNLTVNINIQVDSDTDVEKIKEIIGYFLSMN